MNPMFTPARKKTILFDMNGTLLDNAATRKIAFVKTLNEFTARWAEGNAISPEEVYNSYRRAGRARKNGKLAETRADAVEMSKLREAFSAMPFTINDGFAQSFLHRFREIAENSAEPFRDVHKMLRKLAEKYELAIITNGSRDRRLRQYRHMAIDALIPRERVFTPIKGKGRKPDPAFFHHVLQQMRTEPEKSVMVGDSWAKDIVGAIRTGMDAVWICPAKKELTTTKSGRSTIVVIHSCNKLLDLFA